MRAIMIIALMVCAGAARAESLMAAHSLRPHTVLAASDLEIDPDTISGAAISPDAVIGLETRVAIYAGNPILLEDLAPPATVERNQLVKLIYSTGTLSILAEGRSLGRGGPGDMIRVMNTSSRTTVSGTIGPDGLVHVTP